jgi:glycosyltransferase involved in cell wall biosynthesis
MAGATFPPSATIPVQRTAGDDARRDSRAGGRAQVLAIVPAWNEEEALPGTLAQLREHAPHVDVLVVDDGSTDATSAVARRCGVRVATLPYNTGVGGALRVGFSYAAEHGYRRALQVDADGQHDPAQIAALLSALDGGAQMAIGTRFDRGESEPAEYRVSVVRAIAMHVLRFMLRVLLGQRFTDTSSGFRAFDRSAIELFASNYPTEYLSDTVEALLMLGYSGGRIVEVPVAMRERQGGIPSHRNAKLAAQYLRLIAAVTMTISFRGSRRARRVAATAARQRGAS